MRFWSPGAMFALVVLAGVAGCRDTPAPEPRTPARAVAASGAVFGGVVGETISAPLTVNVLDHRDRPVEGARVTFGVVSGTGTRVTPSAAQTDAAGQVSVRVTLGSVAGATDITAMVSGLPNPVRFSGVALPGSVARLAIVPRFLRFRSLVDSATIRVETQDAFGNSVPGGLIRLMAPDSTAVSVSPSGVVRALRSGVTSRIVATSGVHSDTAFVSAQDPAFRPCDAAGSAVQVAVGAVVPISLAGGVCLRADGTGGEYVLIPFLASTTPTTSASFEVQASGVTIPAPIPAAPRVMPEDDAPGRDEGFHERLRRDESAVLEGIARRREREPALAALVAPLTLGSVLSLNANAFSDCRDPDLRTGRVVVVSTKAIVVADTANPPGGFTDADYRRFAAAFDTLVHTVNVDAFGEPQDIDRNGRAIVFFTRAVNELSPASSNSFVGGFFWARDFTPKSECGGSNEAEMFYMMVPDPDGLVTNARGVQSRSFRHGFVDSITVGTLAHEYQHLINAGRRAYVTRTNVAEQGWLNEALSHVAEELVFHRQARVLPRRNLGATHFGAPGYDAAFLQYVNSNMARYRTFLQEPALHSPFADESGTGTGVQARGASWAWLRYLADHRGAGDGDVWRRLANSSTNGFANIREVFGVDPLESIRDWSMANLLDDLGLPVESRYTQPSWNFRSVYPAIPGAARPFPLQTRVLQDDTRAAVTLRAGAVTYLRFAIAPAREALLQLSAGAASGALQFHLTRTK